VTAEWDKVAAAKGGFEVTNTVYDARGKLAEQVYNDGTRVLFDTEGNMTEKIGSDGTVYNIQQKTTTTQGATSGRIR